MKLRQPFHGLKFSVVYTCKNPEGEKLGNGQGMVSVLQTIVTARFPLAFDFAKGLSENQLKLTQAKSSAKSGITQSTSGVVVGIEKRVLPTAWNVERYYPHRRVDAVDDASDAVRRQGGLRCGI